MATNAPLFTVFTGTYNRGKYLERVYRSLCVQTQTDFEWLIVDDGSTDDTRSRVAKMAAAAPFVVRYIHKENGGIHTAHNTAIGIARGELFLRCDSDDELTPTAIEKLGAAWRAIPEAARAKYSGISGLCVDEAGALVGKPYPRDGWDSNWSMLANLEGEKSEARRIAVLRDYPFPVFGGERFVPENLVWARIHDRFNMRCINVVAKIYRAGTPGSLVSRIGRLRYACGNGFALYYREDLARKQRLWRTVKLAANYSRTCIGLRHGIVRIFRDSPRKIWTLVTMPLALVLYAMDWRRGLTKNS